MASTRLLLGLLLVACATVRAEDKTAPLRARLQTAAAESSLDTPSLAPWHLKLEVQLFDDKGKPHEQGTVERWWISPTDVQTTYTFPNYTATEVISATGLRRSKSAGRPPDVVRLLLDQVTHPMPSDAEMEEANPDLRQKTLGTVPLDCVMLDQPMDDLRPPPLGLFPTFCFDAGKDILRLTFHVGSQLIVRNTFGVFQGKHVATGVTITENSINAATGRITTLESRATLRPLPVDDATLEVPPTATPASATKMSGILLIRPEPAYPQSAKERHVQGSVVTHAIIGQDGHIRSLRLVKTPDADLALAALSAVHRWVYRPMLVDGKPVEVETTITVNFRLD